VKKLRGYQSGNHDDTVEQHIGKNYSNEFDSSAIRSKLSQVLSQNRNLKERWNDETLHRIAEKRLSCTLIWGPVSVEGGIASTQLGL
jgi:hypothetical protein